MDPLSSIYLLVATLLLVACNAFFVIAEFSIVKVRRSKLEEIIKGQKELRGRPSKSAMLALKITDNLDTYLSATQLGVTLASLGLGWIGEPAIYRLIAWPFMHAMESSLWLHSAAFIIAFGIITLMHVVLGEIVPKSIAISKATIMTLLIARPLHAFSCVFYPFIWLFDRLARMVLRTMKVDVANNNDLAHSDEELKIIVRESLKGGYIDNVEGEIIKNAIDFSDIIAKEIMTPRKDITCLFAEDSFEENINVVLNTRYTRYPYCIDDKDDILGMVHLRDILNILVTNQPRELAPIVREMILVPESASISKILNTMNKKQVHTALIIDEYGGTAGLLTMEDIIEEIMGDIRDEYDPKNDEIKKLDDNRYELEGKCELEDAEGALEITFDKDCEQITIGGYVFSLFGNLPKIGDVIESDGVRFEVLDMDDKTIKKILATKL